MLQGKLYLLTLYVGSVGCWESKTGQNIATRLGGIEYFLNANVTRRVCFKLPFAFLLETRINDRVPSIIYQFYFFSAEK